MNSNALSARTLARRTKWFFRRFHTIIYFVLVSAGLGYAIINLQGAIEKASTESTYTSNIEAGSIDFSGLEQISNLKKSSEVKSIPQLPSSPRNNPFSE